MYQKLTQSVAQFLRSGIVVIGAILQLFIEMFYLPEKAMQTYGNSKLKQKRSELNHQRKSVQAFA